eukprot:1153421-Pelagomonas_calceolata.AAC.3
MHTHTHAHAHTHNMACCYAMTPGCFAAALNSTILCDACCYAMSPSTSSIRASRAWSARNA